jgi:hypothetical protein
MIKEKNPSQTIINKIIKNKIFLILISLLLVQGCTHYKNGSPNIADQSLTGKIERGITTKNQIKNWFGEPSSVGFKNNMDKWTYGYSSMEANLIPFISLFTKPKIQSRSLELSFDPTTNKVVEYELSNNSMN